MSGTAGTIAALLLSLFYLLLSSARHALFLLGPVGHHRLQEDFPRVGAYFGAGYLRTPTRVRISLQLGTQLFLVAATLVVAFRLESDPPGLRWLWAGLFVVGLSTIVGQVLARGLAALNPERLVVGLLPLVKVVDALLWPVSQPTAVVLRGAANRRREPEGNGDDEDQEEEIEAFIDVGEQEGVLEEGEGRLIRGVLDFGDRVVREVMTPRTAMVAIDEKATVRELRDVVLREKHSRLPAFRDSLDEIIGVVFVRDLMEVLGEVPDDSSITSLIRPTYFVPETKRVSELLRTAAPPDW